MGKMPMPRHPLAAMKIIENVMTIRGDLPHLVLTIGSFDGVHLGHQRILQEVMRRAKAAGGTAGALTMRPHPREFFSRTHAPNLLTTEPQKLELLSRLGLDVVFLLGFGEEVAALDREEFVNSVVLQQCGAKELVVGHDFRFGRNAEGDYDFLVENAHRFGLEVTQLPPLFIEGECVSSTLIRERILQGDLECAAVFLGRPYAIQGTVEPGHGIGLTLGFPTANIKPRNTAIPAQGVYMAQVEFEDKRYPAAVNIGIAPTVRQEDVVIEAHILGFSKSILGRTIDIIFLKRLRPERRFATREALAEQIHTDVEAIRLHFSQF